jgi:hypothetical protein
LKDRFYLFQFQDKAVEIDLILNELSMGENTSIDKHYARQLMSEFINMIRAFKKQQIKANLRTKDDFYTIIVAHDYPIGQWFNEADREERLFIKTLVTKSPFSNDIDNLDIKELETGSGSSEFRHQGKLAVGLGVAYLLDSIAISLRSSDYWDTPYVNIDFKYFEESSHDLIETKEVIKHVSQSNHVREHLVWINRQIQGKITNGQVLWEQKEELFPNLLFCECVRKQLLDIKESNPLFKQIIKRLFELEEQTQKWTDGNFDINLLPSKVTPESDTRLKKFQQQLTFQCPDGIYRLFDLHLRMTPGANRLYFFPIEPQKLIIGYIGLKVQ